MSCSCVIPCGGLIAEVYLASVEDYYLRYNFSKGFTAFCPRRRRAGASWPKDRCAQRTGHRREAQ